MNIIQRAIVCLTILLMGITIEPTRPQNKNAAIMIGATAAVVGAAVYMSYRESNSVKIARAESLMNAYRGQVERALSLFNEHRDMNVSVNGAVGLKAEMVNLHSQLLTISDELESRYGSWIAPWNWTQKMQEACNQVRQFRLQVKLVVLLLSVQQSQELMRNFSVRIDRTLTDLNDRVSFRDILKNSGSLRKDLQGALSLAHDLQQCLKAREFLRDSLVGQSYESVIVKTENGLNVLVQKIDLLLIVLRYTPCFAPDIDDLSLVKAARVICGKDSSYPVMYVVDKLGSDIERINSMTIYVPCEQVCIEMLDGVRTRLMESEYQATERQAYENYLQQQRVAAAAEAQARAAKAQAVAAQCQASAMQQQAWAQHRQAAALEESNKIERQKNKR